MRLIRDDLHGLQEFTHLLYKSGIAQQPPLPPEVLPQEVLHPKALHPTTLHPEDLSSEALHPETPPSEKTQDPFGNDSAWLNRALPQPAAPRSPVSATVRLTPLHALNTPAHPSIAVLVTDVSSTGLTIISETPLELDAAYHTDLSALVGQPYQQTARVIYCRSVLQRTFRIGLTFEYGDG